MVPTRSRRQHTKTRRTRIVSRVKPPISVSANLRPNVTTGASRPMSSLSSDTVGGQRNAERERDDAVKARDAAVLELRAAETQIAAMKEPLTLERFTEAQKRQHDEAIQKLAELREKHAMQGGDNETPAPEPQSD